MVDDLPLQGHTQLRRGVNAAAPDAAAEKVEILRVLAHQQGFRFAVAGLLLQVSADRGTPVVPDKTGVTESELAASLLQTPADIHVVTRRAKHRIEPADFLQRPFVKHHVAAGNVLGLTVGQHDVGRSAGRDHHRRGHKRIIWRQKIVSAHADEFTAQKIVDQVVEPVFVGAAVGVRERNDLTRGCGDTGVARDR